MIDMHQYSRIHYLSKERNLSVSQIARDLSLNEKTVAKWLARDRFEGRRGKGRSSKLDGYKQMVCGWLDRHPYSAAQVLQMLRDEGFSGGYSIVKTYVRKVRPRPAKAYLSLSFAPGENAQVDWGSYGSVAVGNTRRNLSFFVMVLSYSRMMYVEFTLSQKQEHFLQCHENALRYFGGVPAKVMIDNLKTGVLEHREGQPAVFNPRYADFARHYGFTPVACNPRAPHEKGRVENGVGYVKKNLLSGLRVDQFRHLGPQARRWLDEVANQRLHRITGKTPFELWQKEKPHLQALPLNACEIAVPQRLRASSTFRISIDGNRYSVPAQFASRHVDLWLYPDRVLLRHDGDIIAEHVREYGRGLDIENPDHPRALLAERHRARTQKDLQSFLQLGEHSEVFYRQMTKRCLNARVHVKKILALAQMYSRQKVAEAISDGHHFSAYSSDYIANILQQRSRIAESPGPLHLTRPSDLLELESPVADMSIYNRD